MDPLKPKPTTARTSPPTTGLTAGTTTSPTTVTNATTSTSTTTNTVTAVEPATTDTTRTSTSTSTFGEPSKPAPVELNPEPAPTRITTPGTRSGPVTDPTIGGPDKQRAAGAAGARFYGPLHGPPLPWSASQLEAVAAARRGDYGELAQQVAQAHLADDYPGGIERWVLPDLLRGSASWAKSDRDAALGAALNDPDSAQALIQIFNSSGFKALDALGRQHVRQVVAASGYEGVRQLADILFKDPARLTDKVPPPNAGTPPRTVLTELARLATTPLTPELAAAGVTTAQALDSLLCDVANPRDIYQGAAGTCTVTSMQYDLVTRHPGEYARIIADLATFGQSTLRGDGDGDGKKDVLFAQTEYLVPNRAGDGRRLTENWFQSAAMELANGELDYNARLDLNLSTSAAYESHPGLYGDQQRVMLEALYGVGYRTFEGDPAALLRAVRNHGSGGADQHPLLINLRFDGAAPGGDGSSHAVTFSHVDRSSGEERFHFRDPWANGQAMPPAQWDRKTGTYFMPAAAFGERAERVHVADASLEGKPLASRFLPLDPLGPVYA